MTRKKRSRGERDYTGVNEMLREHAHAPREQVCEECGQRYVARSARARFCTPYCRVKHHRRTQSAQEAT